MSRHRNHRYRRLSSMHCTLGSVVDGVVHVVGGHRGFGSLSYRAAPDDQYRSHNQCCRFGDAQGAEMEPGPGGGPIAKREDSRYGHGLIEAQAKDAGAMSMAQPVAMESRRGPLLK